ncbi:MerR family transcriptional regulator [Fibrivirga algicola]|uniref:MerR family transcriptional regulator n=1 Tax=Fibrivirga algicola TaxID=2950420 RepID=A0ABX0QCA9_9BACT|nr:MerR family transcriptional regulator [Fibrivirga algicola]ARK09179.1 MerR family transcriptional regulator [Fibrella sp. ES10-3-2-2]NID08707.1 MerR family transcriptional regulator [Fibrivirga algicola]
MESGDKRYYSIREVADLFNVNISKLRYYEKEFPTLSPKKNRSGDRVYTKAEIEHLREILDLVENRGFKLQGAREYLSKKQTAQTDTARMLDKLREIRQFMAELREKLN